MILALGIPFGKITLFPVVFFPMMYPVFLDLFRQPVAGRTALLKTNIHGTVICLGVGIVVAGHLMFSADPALMTMGRTMTIGWVSFMLPMIVHLVGGTRGEGRGTRVERSESYLSSLTPHPSPLSPIPYSLSPIPLSLATRDQLDFYRKRIEASGIFDDQHEDEGRGTRDEGREVRGEECEVWSEECGVEENDSKLQTGVQDAEQNSTPQITLPEIPEQPVEGAMRPAMFPPVWSVGTGHGSHGSLHRRVTQRIVVELASETMCRHSGQTIPSDQESPVSLASHNTRIVARKSRKITITAKMMQEPQDESQASDTESPTILPMCQQNDPADQPPKPTRRKYG